MVINTEFYENHFARQEERNGNIRANTKHTSKPRTKRRPSTKNLPIGFVLNAARGRYQVLIKNNQIDQNIICSRASEIRNLDIVPGDLVKISIKTQAGTEILGQIKEILPRKTVLKRTTDDKNTFEKIIAANCQQAFILIATKNPDPQPDFVNRVLKACEFSKIKPYIIITKTDLNENFIKPIDLNKIKIIKSTEIEEIKQILQNKITVFIGLSGVGKSTLINKMLDFGVITGEKRETNEVSINGDGRHTSTSSQAFQVKNMENSWVIDTPGIRSFGLGYIEDRENKAF
ncbi:MAG: GTPase RsgA [Candidatus Ancillula sp.]|jgi:ribosome biogenesis GTPase|nr:GTPase RsgA [Candidatus Ancillula sp.]